MIRIYLFIFHLLISINYSFESFSQKQKGSLLYISDGDTFRMVLEDGTKLRIRIADIDCPEKTQPYGLEAKEFVFNQVKNKEVLISIKGTDRYGRKIANVFYGDKNLAEELLKNGYAWHYLKHSNDEELQKLEQLARTNKVGLWADENPVAPWEFRRQAREKKKIK